MGYKIVKMYHPSHRVPDLEAAFKFFNDIFGLKSIWRSDIFKQRDPSYPDFPTDYCLFTPLADVFFDTIDPQKLVVNGLQVYPTIQEPHLNGYGWGVEGAEEIYKKIQEIGVVPVDYKGDIVDPKIPPITPFSNSILYFTIPETSGVRLEFYPWTSMGSYDHRTNPEWQLKPTEGKGSLGIQFCAYHTVLTENFERVQKLYVNFLGGRIIHEKKGTLRGTDSLFVLLADAVFEFAKPVIPETMAMKDYNARQNKSEDVYHALTFKVKDLAQTEAHLKSKGIRLIHKDAGSIVIDPQAGVGIPWGFVANAVENDDRYITEI